MENKKQKIHSLLKRARQELNSFRQNGRFHNLSQACEKTWVAFTLLVELKARKEAKTSRNIRQLAYELGLENLFLRTRYLHEIHYEGSPSLVPEEVAPDISQAIFEIGEILRGRK